jgi:hypothetical protein
MAFGQATGSPASGKQVKELLALLEAAGHESFRDARGPMGFNQRQAAGKFTRDEAQAFIDQLEAEAGDQPVVTPAPPPRATPRPTPTSAARPAAPAPPARTSPVLRLTPNERAVRAVTDKELLAEVRRRGLTLD